MTQRVAIVGGGVSGLVAAHLLHPTFDVTVFERSSSVGGHIHTVDVSLDGNTSWAVDTGFIVYNERNYPNFTKLLERLDIETQPSTMSFSVTRRDCDFEYNGSTLHQLFAQRSNLIRPRFLRMLLDIVRFNRDAPRRIDTAPADMTLQEFLRGRRYSHAFVHDYLIPMGSAIWSAPSGSVLQMPAAFFVRFFANHGMLTIDNRPEWRVIRGGSRRYVEKLVSPFRDRLRVNRRVHRVCRETSHVLVDNEPFDQVVMACHADESLALLDEPTPAEREILQELPYQRNEIVLHTDPAVLPRRRSAWAAWNYHLGVDPAKPVGVTYNMNILQSLDAPKPLCVTLNDHSNIAEDAILYRTTFAHPQFTPRSLQAQRRFREISGLNRTHYCGAYWGNGFHEDGVNSAIQVARTLGAAA